MKKELILEAVKNNFNVSDQFKKLNLQELRNKCAEDRLPISICLLNITGDLNIGVSIRTALNLGVKRVFIIGNKRFDKRSCVGSHNYIDIVKVKATDKHDMDISSKVFFDTMKEHSLRPVAVEQGGLDIRSYTKSTDFLNEEICFVFGNEGMGIPEDILNNIETIVSIPQLGVLRSYNVSAAASILLWEVTRKYV